jgi:AcrR family transcriptional regulator
MKVVKRRRYQKRLKASERREAVLDAALSLITRTGVFQVTMAEVAEEGGVTKPIVYDYFANVDELLAALLQREGARAFEVLGEVLPDPASLPARGDRAAILLEKVELFLRAVQERPSLWRLTLMPPDGTAPAVRARVDAAREAVRQRIVSLLGWGLHGGRPLDLDLASHAIHALAQRFAREMIVEPGEYTPERIMTFVRRLLKLTQRGRGDGAPARGEAPGTHRRRGDIRGTTDR